MFIVIHPIRGLYFTGRTETWSRWTTNRDKARVYDTSAQADRHRNSDMERTVTLASVIRKPLVAA